MMCTIEPKLKVHNENLFFERIWNGTLKSMASNSKPNLECPTTTMTAATTTTVASSATRRFVDTTTIKKPKVGRRFFQHDTRNNESTNLAISRKRKFPYKNQRAPPNRNGRPVGVSNTNEMLPFDREHSDATQSAVDVVNTKLRKKLFKIQRKLRLQTVALKQQCATQLGSQKAIVPAATIPSGCCCSCACSSSAGDVMMSTGYNSHHQQQQLHHHHRNRSHQRPAVHEGFNYAAGGMMTFSSDSSEPTTSSHCRVRATDGAQSVHGLRSVIR